MASWLRNFQDKLENVASSVDRLVQEAASEVTMNPEVEMEVEKDKRIDAEKAVLIEQNKNEELQKRVDELEEQLLSTNIENDAIKERFQQMIRARDEQIKQYERELEHLRNWQPHDDDGDDDKLTRLKEENSKLRKEISEWKKVAREGSPGNSSVPKIKELQDEILRLKEKHTEELADITYSNQQMIAEVRQDYESLIQKIKENHAPLPRLEHKSESDYIIVDIPSEKTLDENIKVNEEFMRSMSVSLDEIKEENVDLTKQIKELEERIYGLMKQLEKEHKPILQTIQIQTESDSSGPSDKEIELSQEVESLKALNAEMAIAYNDLNTEFEKHKSEHGSVMHANSDLVSRIDALKASLIEYEERYELCKAEHMKTVNQLEKLTSDFEKLRSNFQITKRSSDQNEEKMNQEMLQLKGALEKTKLDRDNFRTEVKSFRDSVSSISSELNQLRENNRRVMDDNVKLAESLSRQESVQEMLRESNDELAKFRERLAALQNEHNEKIKHLEVEKAELEERILELEDQLNPTSGWVTTSDTSANLTLQTQSSFTTDIQTEFEIFEPKQKEILEDEITLLRQQIDDQNEEIDRLRQSESENTRDLIDKYEIKLDELQQLVRDTREEKLYHLEKEIDDKNLEIRILQTEWLNPQESSRLKGEILELREQNENKDMEIDRLQTEISEKNKLSQQDLNFLKNTLSAREALIEKLQQEWLSPEQKVDLDEHISSLRSQIIFQEQEISRLQNLELENATKIKELQENAYSLQNQLSRADLHEQIEKLNKLVFDKHAELEQANIKLAMQLKEREKAAKELQRLREHLFQIEDISTKETIQAEERETELRKRIREMEEHSSAVLNTVEHSENCYQQQVGQMSARIYELEVENQKLHENFLEKEKSFSDTSKSLSNLQHVLRELSMDHEKEIRQYEDDLESMKKELTMI